MASHDRLDLHREFVDLFAPNKVYYEPPETLKITYPCIIYGRDYIKLDKADNFNYIKSNRYQLMIIDRNSDNKVIETILDHFSSSSYDRHYIADGLHHDVITLYY